MDTDSEDEKYNQRIENSDYDEAYNSFPREVTGLKHTNRNYV